MIDWACFGFIRNPENKKILLVQDAGKKPPHLWKMPGGKRKPVDGLRFSKTLSRELEEELPGFDINIFTSSYLRIKDLGDHLFIVIEGEYSSFNISGFNFKAIKDVEQFSPQEVEELIKEGKVLENHAEFLREVL